MNIIIGMVNIVGGVGGIGIITGTYNFQDGIAYTFQDGTFFDFN